MKRLPVIVLFSIMIVVLLVKPVVAQEENGIRIFIDKLPLSSDVAPLILNGRTLVPFRTIAEALNVKVNWDEQTQTVSAAAAETQIQLKIGNETAYYNQTPVTLDMAPQIIDGRTLIPLRFFSTAFGCTVEWIEVSREIIISSPPRKMTVLGFYALGDSRTSSWTNLFGVPYPESSKGNTDVVGTLALGWYSMDQNGALLTRSRTGWQRPDGWENVLKVAGEYALVTEMVVHVTDGDGTVSSLLANEEALSRAVEAITEEAAFYEGVNLNFEGLGLSQRGEELKIVQETFTRFVSLLYGQLSKSGKNLTLTIHPPNSEYRGYDYGSLAETADRIVIMAYDYGPRPEPLNLVQQAVEMAKREVPPEKLLLGISVPYETAESIVPKIGIAKRHNLEGIALWRLGLISEEIWDVLREMVSKK